MRRTGMCALSTIHWYARYSVIGGNKNEHRWTLWHPSCWRLGEFTCTFMRMACRFSPVSWPVVVVIYANCGAHPRRTIHPHRQCHREMHWHDTINVRYKDRENLCKMQDMFSHTHKLPRAQTKDCNIEHIWGERCCWCFLSTRCFSLRAQSAFRQQKTLICVVVLRRFLGESKEYNVFVCNSRQLQR